MVQLIVRNEKIESRVRFLLSFITFTNTLKCVDFRESHEGLSYKKTKQKPINAVKYA